MKLEHIVTNSREARVVAQAITEIELHRPVRVTIETLHAKRSADQNRLQRMWMNEAAEQLKDDTAEGWRAYCKLHIGVPILCAGDEMFRDKYDRVFGKLTYEEKLIAMAVPLDFPVTRLMTTKQKTDYLDAVWHFFTSRGVRLTDPNGAWR